jgi:hypothetical protein
MFRTLEEIRIALEIIFAILIYLVYVTVVIFLNILLYILFFLAITAPFWIIGGIIWKIFA